MKKSLIALATLAAATGAFAQSSVEIYGYLDVGVAKLKGGQVGVNNTSYVVPASQAATALTNSFARSGLTTNYIGFRGTEDLGGGMKATFNLQTGGLDTSTGSNALAFSRESNLGLAGGFGALKIGRSVSTICAVGCSFDYNGIGNGDGFALNGLSPASIKASSRRSNQIEYTAPTLVQGLTTRVSTIMKGDAVEDSTFSQTLGSATAGRVYKAVYTVGLNYDNGPVRLAYAYEGAASNDATKRAAQFAVAEYNFGVAKANIAYTINDTIGGGTKVGTGALGNVAGATSGKGFGIGLAVPVGAATVGVQYANNTENKTKATELFARYSLSKRTELYSYYAATSGVTAGVEGAAFPATADNKVSMAAQPANPTTVGFGIRHAF